MKNDNVKTDEIIVALTGISMSFSLFCGRVSERMSYEEWATFFSNLACMAHFSQNH